MKRSFTATFWLLLFFGLLQLLWISTILHSLFAYGAGANSYSRSLVTPVFLIRIFMWPLISVGEAWVYWLIRRRNSFRALSWAHSAIYMLAFLLNFVFSTLYRYYWVSTSAADYRVNWQIVMHELQYFFWGLLILAHLAFVAVLANCFRKPPPIVEDAGENKENILDDVVL
jgi:hypothetical protein